nr:AP-3 complex subunit delta-1 [Polyrhizophydium stewartii]
MSAATSAERAGRWSAKRAGERAALTTCRRRAGSGLCPRCLRRFEATSAPLQQPTGTADAGQPRSGPCRAGVTACASRQSTTDLIRGLRANKKSEERFVANAIDEIRVELRKNDLDIKTNAVSKLCVLHMMGYDMSWASFHIIEVMSSPKLSQKRVGYAAAAMSFRQDTDVLMLCTNLIKKDLASNNSQDGAVAMHALAQIVTPDLGRDLHLDLVTMLNHSKPYMRKRAILVLYRVFLKYPEALRAAYPRLKERLDDSDPSVVSAAVNVICELARKNPKSYLPLAPQLYGLLTSSNNNWMLIKIIKLFAALTPLEPRLVRKLVPPIVNLIQTTSAMSLIYECVHTLIVGGMIAPERVGDGSAGMPPESPQDTQVALLCINKLKLLLEDHDQNLKYLGLYALGKMLLLRPSAVGEHREIVLKCLGDADYSIRMRALDLIANMINPDNLFGIVKHLMMQLVPRSEGQPGSKKRARRTLGSQESSYRLEVAKRIIAVCSKDTFANIANFEWYISILIDLSFCPGINVGMLIAHQFIEVCVRVKEIVPFAVASLAKLLSDTELLESATKEINNTHVLYGVAWVVGEFCEHLHDPVEAMDAMMLPQVNALSPTIHAMYLSNLLKIFAFWAAGKAGVPPPSHGEHADLARRIVARMTFFTTSSDLEVQDRASMVLEVLKLVLAESDDSAETNAAVPSMLETLPALFAAELNPVAPKAQRKVPIPDGLDLDSWIHEPVDDTPQYVPESSGFYSDAENSGMADDDPRAGEAAAQRRQERVRNDPYYLAPQGASPLKSASLRSNADDIDSIPIVPLTLDDGPGSGRASSGGGSRGSSPVRHTALFAKPRAFIDDPALVASMARPSPKRYQIKTDEDLPGGSGNTSASGSRTALASGADGPESLEEIRRRDPDRYAVMSVDLTGAESEQRVSARTSAMLAGSRSSALLSPAGPSSAVSASYEMLPDPSEPKKKKKKSKDGGAGDVVVKKKKKRSKKAAVDQPAMDESAAGVDDAADAASVLASLSVSGTEVSATTTSSTKKTKKSKKPKTAVIADAPSGAEVEVQQTPPEVSAADEIPATPVAIPSSEFVVFEDDHVVLAVTWEHDPAPELVPPSVTKLPLAVRVVLRLAEGSSAAIAHVDLQALHGLTAERESEFAYVVRGSALRTGEDQPFESAEWAVRLAYSLQTSPAEPHTNEIEIVIPPVINMFPPTHEFVTRITTEHLLALMTTEIALLPHAMAAQLVLPPSVAFEACVARIAARLGVRVVETHEAPMQAASFYGFSVLGVHVAGLIKNRSPAAAAGQPGPAGSLSRKKPKGVVVAVDLRCGSPALLERLMDEVHAVASDFM